MREPLFNAWMPGADRVRPVTLSRVSIVALVVGSAALAGPPAAAAPPKATIAADCRDHRGSGDLVVRACLAGSMLRIELGTHATSVRARLQRAINPEGTFADEVIVTAFDAKRVALSYDDTECGVALLVDRETGAVLADSACTNSRYCEVARLPAIGAKEVAVACSDESGTTSIAMLPLPDGRSPPPTATPHPAPKAAAPSAPASPPAGGAPADARSSR